MSIIFIHLFIDVCIPNKFKSPVWGCTEISGGECHRPEIWVKEKMTSFECSYSSWGFWQQCWHMCRWPMAFPLHMCSGLPTKKVKQMIMTSSDDITMIACATEGGKYIRRAHLGFGTVIWVSGTEQFSLLLSHWPSTLAILVPLMEQEYTQDELSSLFISVHAPRLFGNTLVSMTLVVW